MYIVRGIFIRFYVNFLTINSTAKATGAATEAAATILSVIIAVLESLSRLKIIFCYNHFYDISLKFFFLCMFSLVVKCVYLK